MGQCGEEHVCSNSWAERSTRLQHFLDEPRPDAVSDEKHARRGAICGKDFIEKLDMRLDLGWQRHTRRLGESEGAVSVDTDVGRQSEMGVSEYGHRRVRRFGDGFTMDSVQKRHVKVEEPWIS